MQSPVVGIIANPISARDIRRVVSYASNMQVTERANIVLRVMAGLAATGVNEVVMMPENAGIRSHVLRSLRRSAKLGHDHFPKLRFLDMPVTGEATDSALAAKMMKDANVDVIVVLGGDGTHRVVISECGNTPIASISTGTNNAFPDMREPTVTGLAVGLVATKKIPAGIAYSLNKRLDVTVNDRHEIALVDVAIVAERYVGSRAIWRIDNFKELFVTFGEPTGIGMSSIAGVFTPVSRTEPCGRHIVFTTDENPPYAFLAPIAPGLIEKISVLEINQINFDQPLYPMTKAGSIALDGEREISFSEKDEVSIILRDAAFQTIDVQGCVDFAAAEGLLSEAIQPQ